VLLHSFVRSIRSRFRNPWIAGKLHGEQMRHPSWSQPSKTDESHLLSGMCSPDSNAHTRSKDASWNGWCSASPTWKTHLSARPAAAESSLPRWHCLLLSVIPSARQLKVWAMYLQGVAIKRTYSSLTNYSELFKTIQEYPVIKTTVPSQHTQGLEGTTD
jgi:hypothetical protein